VGEAGVAWERQGDLGVNNVTGSIIDLKHAHLTEMVALRKKTQELHHKLLPDVFPVPIDEDNEWRLMHAYMPKWRPFRRRTLFGIGWLDGDILGGYLLYFDYVNPEPGTGKINWARAVTDIAVQEAYQRRGVAKALVTEVRDRAGRSNISAIYANVWAGNEASAALFEKAGFNIQMNYFCLPVKRNNL
jgi:RimJ/RimL family protein N-acetyltransferase